MDHTSQSLPEATPARADSLPQTALFDQAHSPPSQCVSAPGPTAGSSSNASRSAATPRDLKRSAEKAALIAVLAEVLCVQRLIAKLTASALVSRGSARAIREVQREAVLGLAMISDQLVLVLADQGVESFGASAGMPLDLKRHKVLDTVERSDCPPATVVEVLRPGHALADGTVIEPALVLLSVAPPHVAVEPSIEAKGDER